ncbi:hypothetical protein BDB00DRAFT_860216 [Zychaea mexicana]|uniref:uncharacterized protein n=1 Tax=Zychaea mexicana TaxID=64656 RepID=UPI0022FED6B9|nr:uncharacterized protein BDB00DRAFT_860216 [Zychaea mexicana]KAI9474848.1 hypothetical protein BDB00DRAFT_860216 [Zychaea mexicana]
MPSELHPFTDFHKAGYLYLLCCWAAFLSYCVLYQTDQFIRIWVRRRSRRRNRYRKRRKLLVDDVGRDGDKDDDSDDDDDDKIITPLQIINDFLRPLEYTVTIPYVATMISLKHLIGMTLFSIINVIFCYFAPFKLHPEVKEYEWPIAGIIDRRGAYVCMANWSFAIALGTRNSIITSMCGMTFEQLIPFHRWVARVGLAETFFHIVYRWWEGAAATGKWYDSFMFNEEYFSGSVSTVGYMILFFTSFNYIRRNYFRTFYYSHLLGFVVGTAGAMWHEWSCIYFFYPTCILWVLDRALRSYKSWCEPIELIDIKQHNEKVVHARFSYAPLKSFRPGQYFFTAFLTGSKEDDNTRGWQGWLQQRFDWYPMTVSDVYNRDIAGSQERAASIHIKTLGDGTRQLMENVRDEPKKVDLRVDGPYGPRLHYIDYKAVALFALGIGITPALTVLKDCIERPDHQSRVRRVFLIWSAINADEVQPFVDYISHCRAYPSSVQLNVTIHLTREQDDAKCAQLAEALDCKVVQGKRPNIPVCLDRIANIVGHRNVWVHTCGSVPFMTTIINEATRHKFDFHHETFEF